ncbi:MAG: hypothetical protein JWL77_5944 [Chthonomonadaceae bacterium]|nr:hypothetical protein [Chthonomonadaceae bacterium]
MNSPLRRIVLTACALASLSLTGANSARAQAPVLPGQEPTPNLVSDKEIAPAASTNAPKTAPASAKPAPVKKGFQFFLSERLRDENYNWWPTDKANGAYNFVGSLLRFGVSRQTARDDFFLELQNTTFVNLPTKAIAAAPQGQLGQGATYFASNGSQVASLFPHQLYFRLKDPTLPGQALKLGRFEYSDGAEMVSADPSLAWLKKNRIAERLIGSFGYSDVGRSFDGFEYSSNKKASNVTLMGAFPTRGVFDLNGSDTLTDVRLASLSFTKSLPGKKSVGEGRVFAIYYEDVRGDVKTDNRTAAVRATDKKPIRIATLGGNYTRVHDVGAGKLDTLLWYAGQFGQWGAQHQGAYAIAAEIGYQLPKAPLKPWFRAGYYLGSGDGGSSNGQHGTFFPILPTPRIYARDPFYNESNLQDIFLQAILRTAPKHGMTAPLFTIRGDVHSLRLADSHDLWYGGGGAYDNAVFGYNGRPSNGKGDLATLVDLSVDYAPVKSTTVTAYLSYANGGNVISSIYKSRDSVFAYLELNYRY